jgi:hypothetical protein
MKLYEYSVVKGLTYAGIFYIKQVDFRNNIPYNLQSSSIKVREKKKKKKVNKEIFYFIKQNLTKFPKIKKEVNNW